MDWEKWLIQSIGPLVTAVVGTMLIGPFVAWLPRKAQDRRSQNQLRIQLIGQMTKVASSLYMATQNFWRNKEVEKVGNDELAKHREELDQQYRASRVMGEVIGYKLQAYFSFNDPKTRSLSEAHWHATMDSLTVRYFDLIEQADEKLRDKNKGDKHTGLTVDELKSPEKVLDNYRDKLRTSVQAVLQEPMRPPAG